MLFTGASFNQGDGVTGEVTSYIYSGTIYFEVFVFYMNIFMFYYSN